MAMFLILAPFGAFSLLMLVASTPISLLAAAALSLGIVGYDMIRGGSIKILAAGSVLVFGALGGYVTLLHGELSPVAARIAVDIGVLAIALGSLAIRLPFTLQYAREAVDPEVTLLPGFLRANYIITWAWTAAFAMMLVANLLMIYLPSLPLWLGLAIAFAARNSAVYFTRWYPQYFRARQIAKTLAKS
jgi:hypothetical protein